jgi:hypothetical protein
MTFMAQNIFEIINCNIVALSEDLLILHRKVDDMYKVLYPPQEMPNATGESLDEEQISSETH